MYVIYNPQANIYIHVGGKIILFESPQEAQEFLQAFTQYVMTRPPLNEEDLFEMHNRLGFLQSCTIEIFTDSFTCGSITWKEYKNSKERKRKNG